MMMTSIIIIIIIIIIRTATTTTTAAATTEQHKNKTKQTTRQNKNNNKSSSSNSKSNSKNNNNVLYLYIYIALLAVHSLHTDLTRYHLHAHFTLRCSSSKLNNNINNNINSNNNFPFYALLIFMTCFVGHACPSQVLNEIAQNKINIYDFPSIPDDEENKMIKKLKV